MKTHTIHWKSLINGTIGAGTSLFEKDEAERLAEELNREYPGIRHEAVQSVPASAEGGSGQPVEERVCSTD